VKRGQVIIVVLAVVAVAAVAIASSGGGGDDKGGGGGGGGGGKAPPGSIRVSFAYSPEKETLLAPLIRRFNDRGEKVEGRPVFIDASVVASGDAETKIAKGRLQPVAWSPASSLWARLLNFDADRPLAPRDNPSIVRTPLVIAMWEPFAKALGWPRKKIGFGRILKLARDQAGFGSVGHPEYGRFKLVHTNPDFSTSGLEAVVAEYYSATGKKEGLTEGDISNSAARRSVRDIEQSIVHYGDTTLFISDQMRKDGPGYASAVAMEEATLLDFNRHRGGQPKLVALYPPEGTFYSDDPFVVLDGPWVDARERAGAKAFQKFLAREIDPGAAARSGFRPADLNAKPEPPIEKKNGVDPAQPTRVLGLPEPRVLSKAKAAWRADRKPANVLLVVDTSGSMNDESRLVRAKQGLKAFFRQVSPRDRLGLLAFNDSLRNLQGLNEFSRNQRALRQDVNGLVADGGTAIYDATLAGFDQVRKIGGASRINAVVVLTDGEDTDSHQSANEVVSAVRAQGDSSKQVRIFTIAYSAGAEGAEQALKDIAKASGGQEYKGDTEDIESVYRSISSFF
jgi:Ca-activated chloride channel family protein